ncbi:Ltp family lipoprotein [Rhodococcus sp. NPDC058521]|uniref:Ltp family lipoprotein n=1 Tax=Rhodococcus sp. NPDC058521 TaxID=3346536 RepID=UPI00364C0226
MTTPAGWHPDPQGSGQLRWWDGEQWTSALQPNASGTQANPNTGGPKRKKWPWIAGAAVVLFIVIGAVNAPDKSEDVEASSDPSTVAASSSLSSAVPSTTTSSTTESTTTEPSATTTIEALPPAPIQVTPAESPAPAPPPTAERETTTQAPANSGMTSGQRNAARAAENYLDISAFSRQGLIEQLEYEQYSTADATFAVDHVAPNWNEQAAKSAQQYLEISAFSRQGLIDQLIYEGYTNEQAIYGVDQAGI